MLVSRGEAPLGIVYRTDAHRRAARGIVDTFPETSHPPIVYPAALSPPRRSGGRGGVLDFLKIGSGTGVFERQGFTCASP